MSNKVIDLIEQEKKDQIIKWGNQSWRSDQNWLAILVEEVGEVSREICELTDGRKSNDDRLIKELVQVAAVCVSWLEILTIFKEQENNLNAE